MRQSIKELENAIVVVGTSLNMGEATKLLLVKAGHYSTIRELLFKLFTENRQDYFEKDDNVYQAIQLIRTYCQEMSKNGEVKFDVPYVYKQK